MDLSKPEQKFFKTVIRIEVLSPDKPLGDFNFSSLDQMITYGDCSGKIEVVSEKQISNKQMVIECKKHGENIGFFDLDEEGNRTDFWHISN